MFGRSSLAGHLLSRLLPHRSRYTRLLAFQTLNPARQARPTCETEGPLRGRCRLGRSGQELSSDPVLLIVTLTLLKQHLNRYPVAECVHQQVYLHPYLKELTLRNPM